MQNCEIKARNVHMISISYIDSLSYSEMGINDWYSTVVYIYIIYITSMNDVARRAHNFFLLYKVCTFIKLIIKDMI